MSYGESILEEIVSQLPGAVVPAVNIAMWNILDEFCTKTNSWQEDMELVLADSVVRYSIPVPSGAALVRIVDATHRGIRLREMDPGSISMRGRIRGELDGDSAVFSPSDTMIAYVIYSPEYITVTTPPTPTAAETPMTLRLALKPARGCSEDNPLDFMPDWFVDRYRTHLVDGVLWRMMAQPSRPYSDKTLAQYHAQRFRGGMNTARGDMIYGPFYGGAVVTNGGFRS